MSRSLACALLAVLVSFWNAPAASGVIVLGSGDPAFNDVAQNPPGGPLANSGGQYEGAFLAFLGTAVAPQFFITANHIGGSIGDTFTFHGSAFSTTATYGDPTGTDLRIWKISGSLPLFAPLYVGQGNEVGQQLVAYGRGTQRGTDALMNSSVVGWFWGAGDSVIRWGTNIVAGITNGGSAGNFLYATFDQPGLGQYECHLSVGDSGGGLFIQDAGAWKLAGVHYAVDGPFSYDPSGADPFNAALFDARGFYTPGSNGWVLIPDGAAPVPTGFYSTQVSSRVPWILSVIAPNADDDGDGLDNLAAYAFGGSPLRASPAAVPTVSMVQSGSDQFVAITYTQPNLATDLTYTVEVSADLQTWNSGDAFTTLVSDVDQGAVHQITVRDNSPRATNANRFIRVMVSRP